MVSVRCSRSLSGCIFVQNSIQTAYLCTFSFLLHICANLKVHILCAIFHLSCDFIQNLRILSQIATWQCVVFVHRHKNRLIKTKYIWWYLVFFVRQKIKLDRKQRINYIKSIIIIIFLKTFYYKYTSKYYNKIFTKIFYTVYNYI